VGIKDFEKKGLRHGGRSRGREEFRKEGEGVKPFGLGKKSTFFASIGYSRHAPFTFFGSIWQKIYLLRVGFRV